MRVIARLDIKGPNVVKGVRFEALRVMGKPAEMAEEYFLQGADELLYIDVVASLYRRDSLLHIVREASRHVHIPFTAGGGVRSIDDIRDLLQAGADKVAINTAAIKRPELITEAAQMFGSQCVVVSIEAKRHGGVWEAYVDGGREKTGKDVIQWAKEVQSLGAGEILLTSVDQEGTQKGLDQELISAVSSAVSIPVIASGGASSAEEIATSLFNARADAVAVASTLHYGTANIADIKDALIKKGLQIREPLEKERAQRGVAFREQDVANYNRFTLRQFGDSSLVDISTGVPPEESVEKIRPEDADVCVINYEINNVRSVVTGFDRVGKVATVVQTPEAIRAAKRLVLPGVGSFAGGMQALRERGLIEPILERAKAGVPILGVCLGMQLLFEESEEFGAHEGLGLIPGKVISLPDPSVAHIEGYKLPHIGWSPLLLPQGKDASLWQGTILNGFKPGERAYFVHSFYPVPTNQSDILATANYGGVEFCSVVRHKNISAAQFHPEKSAEAGLAMLAAFCEQNPL